MKESLVLCTKAVVLKWGYAMVLHWVHEF